MITSPWRDALALVAAVHDDADPAASTSAAVDVLCHMPAKDVLELAVALLALIPTARTTGAELPDTRTWALWLLAHDRERTDL